ncbi:MAG: endonuclease/exonuclease/phosphatase family protein [Flavobacteriales bacterium]|nr:endonuclease/exonuclease/phosphatase family protein [Flavobacteriales bacterium]MCB9192700.1 endonuclease/exonuclease/phosphatase family protein [Flavobacteriales bacterium]MCB9205201.1 endonuclease/exonuclease/phosphatase family protein [Flavobacteriales bacterium]
MKIATWNIERLKHANRLAEIEAAIKTIDVDILILTESDTRINLEYPFVSMSDPLNSDYYRNTERRVTIHSKFEIVSNHETYDGRTAVCPEIASPFGNLLIYGTIIGIHGNRRLSFKEDLRKQLLDFERLSGRNFCIAGDFNISFSDNYYHTNFGRDSLNKSFERNRIQNLTAGLPETIDHICVSEDFVRNRAVKLLEWNQDKTLSDHKGVCVSLEL